MSWLKSTILVFVFYLSHFYFLFKEMGIPDHRTASWEICMQVKKQQLEPDVEQYTGSR